MVVPLRIRDLTYSWSFKEIRANSSPRYLPILVELNFNKLTKTTEKFNMFKYSNSKIQNIPYCQSAVAVTDSRVHLELLFFTVFALPNASSTGLDYVHSTTRKDVSADTEIKEEKKTWKRDQFFPTSRTCCSTVRPSVPDLPPMNARYLMSIFVVSVLPAPLSPLTNMDWLPWSLISALKLLPPTRKKKPIKLQTLKCYCLQIIWLQ